MRIAKPNVADHFSPYPLEESIVKLEFAYSEWEKQTARGTKSLWKLLGNIYEMGSAIAKNDTARVKLMKRLAKNPTVSNSARWKAENAHPFDLLLVMVHGLSDSTKATKSQWLRALKIAEKHEVKPTQDDFLSWITNIGGVDKALNYGKKDKPPSLTLNELIEKWRIPSNDTDRSFDQIIENESALERKINSIEYSPITIPSTSFRKDAPEGFSLLLVKNANDDNEVWPIATVVSESVITGFANAHFMKMEREALEEEQRILDKIYDLLRAERKVVEDLYYYDPESGMRVSFPNREIELNDFHDEWILANIDDRDSMLAKYLVSADFMAEMERH